MWWNQSKLTDKRIFYRKWINRWEVTLRIDKKEENVIWYREILDDWTLSNFIETKDPKNIPIGSIIVFKRWTWNT